MRKIIVAITFIALSVGVFAQQEVKKPVAADKQKLTLRPNSREFAAVRMTNKHQRMELRKKRSMMMRQQLAKKRLQQMRRGQHSIQHQRKLLQQRRAIRKKMLEQQRKRRMRR